ncbi:recombinase family protein [Eggerthia catenaformis]
MHIGYIRVSTDHQNTDRQKDLLKKQYPEIKKFYIDRQSGKNTDRPQLREMMNYARKNDVIVVESLSRLARNTRDLIDITDQLNKNEIHLISLKESIDATTPSGRAMMKMFSVFADFEREIIVERTKEGLASARARGHVGGRPAINKETVANAIKLYDSRNFSIQEICKITGISKGSLYKYIHSENERRKKYEP